MSPGVVFSRVSACQTFAKFSLFVYYKRQPGSTLGMLADRRTLRVVRILC